MRKTKIICTLGPATDREGILEALIREGMNVARFNFSHGTHEEQKVRLEKLKTLRKQFDKPIAALLDTKGPEVRIGCFKDKKVTLEEGQEFTLVNDEVEGTQEQVTISYKDLYKDVKPGDSILIDDGLVGMEVVNIVDKDIVCIVKNGGDISDHKGVNVPGVELKMPFISPKDRDDLLFGIQEDFDFVAASFTRTAEDIREMRQLLNDNGGQEIHIIAKIENQQGVDNIDAIIEAADGIMIARGDMGVEIPLEHVPIIQQKIIQKVYEAGKVVITATQMLDSMMIHPRPTRAETTDVANAIYQGTSAIMLSGETLPQQGEKRGSGYYKCDLSCDLHDSHRPESKCDPRSQQDRKHGADDFQVPSGMPDRRMLQFRKSLQAAESVVGHPAAADQGRVQLGNPLPARYRSGTGTWHCGRRRQDRIHRWNSAWHPGQDKPDPRMYCRRIKIRYEFSV